MVRGCLTAVWVVIALVSAFFVAGGIVQLTTGDTATPRDGSIGLIVIFGGTLIVSVYLLWRMLRTRPGEDDIVDTLAEEPPASPTESDREHQVLRFAEMEHGRVTIPEVAATCDMTIAEAKATLDRLVMHEAAIIQVTEAGVLVYVFPGFLSDEDKARARDF